MRQQHYVLQAGVRARRESFGLLFYNNRDANLTFVKSGELLDVVRGGDGSFALTINGSAGLSDPRVRRLLENLVKRGFIVEARSSL